MRHSVLVRVAWAALMCGTLGLVAAASAPGGAETNAPAPAPSEASLLLSGPYVIDLSKDGGTVCWQSTRELVGAVRVKASNANRWEEIREAKATRFHAVRLSKLAAGAEHDVEVQGDGRKLGELVFRTAPAEAEEFTFFAYGDTRTHSDDHATVATAMLAEARRLKQFTFVVHTGDFAEAGSDDQATAEQFFRPAASLLARLPLVPVRGNHENKTDLFKKYFPLPKRPPELGDADDRCVDYGSVRVVVLDKYAPPEALEARMKWLAQKLAEAKDRWRFVAFHEPIYSSGKHRSALRFRAAVEPILVAGRAHVVLAGHDHNYERTKPVKGVTHFTAGGGGAPLRDQSSAGLGPWSARFKTVHHFLTITVTPRKLTVQALCPQAAGKPFKRFDSVDIPKDCGWPTQARKAGAAPQAPR
ncbi:MAG TPA: metallophosphoesterase [Phycisphaerae bacterium]|nr:metallophosphoesterase [Phycisphaerae bacterium]